MKHRNQILCSCGRCDTEWGSVGRGERGWWRVPGLPAPSVQTSDLIRSLRLDVNTNMGKIT